MSAQDNPRAAFAAPSDDVLDFLRSVSGRLDFGRPSCLLQFGLDPFHGSGMSRTPHGSRAEIELPFDVGQGAFPVEAVLDRVSGGRRDQKDE
jgi:hypothetical protein